LRYRFGFCFRRLRETDRREKSTNQQYQEVDLHLSTFWVAPLQPDVVVAMQSAFQFSVAFPGKTREVRRNCV
jgi:hypothetical protein